MEFIFAAFSVAIIVYKIVGLIDVSWPIVALPAASGLGACVIYFVASIWME